MEKKNVSNLVSVAGASFTVPSNEIRLGGEKGMKREKEKKGRGGDWKREVRAPKQERQSQ